MVNFVSPSGEYRKTSSTKPAVLGKSHRSIAARNKNRNPCQRCKKRKHGCTVEDGANQCNNCKRTHATCVRIPAAGTPTRTSKSNMCPSPCQTLPDSTSTSPHQTASPNHHGDLHFIFSDLCLEACPPEVIAQQSYDPITLSSYDRPYYHTTQQTMPTRYSDLRELTSTSSRGQHQNGMPIAVDPTSPRQLAQTMSNMQVFHEDANSGGYLDMVSPSTGPPSIEDSYLPITQPLDYMLAILCGYPIETVGIGCMGYNPLPLAWAGTNSLPFSNQEYPNAFIHGEEYIGMYGDASRIAAGHADQFSYWLRFP